MPEAKRGTGTTPRAAMDLRRTWQRIGQRLDTIASSLDKRPPALFFLFLLSFYYGMAKTERIAPLWHDELYTLYIAQAPNFKTMMVWIQTIDLNPPLYYLLARLTFHVLPPTQLSVRLPSLIGFFVATLCLYQFIRRRTSPLYGMLGALVLLTSSFGPYAYQARPYALALGFLGLLALGWQRAIAEPVRGRWPSLLLVVFSAYGMLLSHVLASVAYASLLLTELIRTLLRRRVDWILWICLIVPLSACVTYLQPVAHHSSDSFPQQFQASVEQLFTAYGDIWSPLAILLCGGLMVVALLETVPPAEPQAVAEARPGFSLPEIIFAAGLCCVPLVVALVFMHSHSAYFERYGMPAIFGVPILAAAMVAHWTRASSRAALVCSLFLLLGIVRPESLARHLQALLPPPHTTPAITGISATPYTQVLPNLPFVDASGLTFLEMNNREAPGFLSRVYYLTDEPAAIHYANATIFEGMPNLLGKFPIKANVEPYPAFIQQHHQFLVFGTYDYPEDWLLRKLLADGATLKFLGEYPSTYKDNHLYEVTLAH